MAAFDFHRRRTRRWWYMGAALLAVALFAVFSVGAASGKLGASKAALKLSGSPYDGSDGTLDTVTGITAADDVASGSSDNAFGQGTKEDDPNVSVVDGSIPPNKNDLTHFYEGSTLTTDGVFLYLGWSRAVNIGNANLDFEINKNATTVSGSPWTGSTTGSFAINRRSGDILVTYDFGGSGAPTLGLNRWLVSAADPVVDGFESGNVCYSAHSFPCWGDHKDLGNTISEGSVSSDGLFGEAVINLTAAGVLGSGVCDFGQATTFLKSRSSSSFTAELKDFIAPVSTPVNPCSTITIIKHTLNGAGTRSGIDKSFAYTTTGTGLSGFSLNDKNGNTGDVTCSSTVTTCNKKVFSGLGQGSYSVTETLPVTNYDFKDLTCTATGTGTSVTPSASPGGNSTPTANITLAYGGSVTCTYTNQQQTGALLIKKNSTKTGLLVKNAGATFCYSGTSGCTSSTSGATQVTDSTSGTGTDSDTAAGEVCLTGLTPGGYYVNETGAPTGYAASSSNTEQHVTVTSGTNCSTNKPTTLSTGLATFSDPPLSDIQVNFKDDGSGETNGTGTSISCDNGTNGTTSTTAATGWDKSVTVTNIKTGSTDTVIHCTITIDP